MSRLLLILGLAFASTVQSQVTLASAANFAVLGADAISNTGKTVITGDAAIWPFSIDSVTGFPPGKMGKLYGRKSGGPTCSAGKVTGLIGADNSVATDAHADVVNAYAEARMLGSGQAVSANELGAKTLKAGKYDFDGAATLNGVITLDGTDAGDNQWVFMISSDFTTGPSAAVKLINGAKPCNVFWFVAGSTKLGKTTTFVGSLVSRHGIELLEGASSNGGMYTLTGKLVLNTNTIKVADCIAVSPPATSTTSSSVTSSTSVTSSSSVTSSATITSSSSVTSSASITSSTSLTSTSASTTSVTSTYSNSTTSSSLSSSTSIYYNSTTSSFSSATSTYYNGTTSSAPSVTSTLSSTTSVAPSVTSTLSSTTSVATSVTSGFHNSTTASVSSHSYTGTGVYSASSSVSTSHAHSSDSGSHSHSTASGSSPVASTSSSSHAYTSPQAGSEAHSTVVASTPSGSSPEASSITSSAVSTAPAGSNAAVPSPAPVSTVLSIVSSGPVGTVSSGSSSPSASVVSTAPFTGSGSRLAFSGSLIGFVSLLFVPLMI